jgi:hypothetical protein
MHASEPSELTGGEPSSQAGCEPSSQAKPPLAGTGVLPSSQLASLHSTVGAPAAGQTGVELPLAGTGSAPFAQVGSAPSAQVKPSLPSDGRLPSSHDGGSCAAAAGLCTIAPCFACLCLTACLRWRLACAPERRRCLVHAAGCEEAWRGAQRAADAAAELGAASAGAQARAPSKPSAQARASERREIVALASTACDVRGEAMSLHRRARAGR